MFFGDETFVGGNDLGLAPYLCVLFVGTGGGMAVNTETLSKDGLLTLRRVHARTHNNVSSLRPNCSFTTIVRLLVIAAGLDCWY